MRKAMHGLLLPAATCAAAMAFTPAPAVALDREAPSCDRPVTIPSQERALMKRVRHVREALERPNLRHHRILRREARQLSARLARREHLVHSLRLPYERTRTVGQNLVRARNSKVALRVMLRSDRHRDVLLDRDFRHIGIGAMLDCHGKVTYTLNLMGRR